MAKRRRQDFPAEPFAAYLYALPSAPIYPGDYFPVHSGGLLKAAGASGSGGKLLQLDYWSAWIRSDPQLRAWLESGRAFLPPENWPCELDFPDHLSPTDFWACVAPEPGEYGREHSPLRECPGLPELTAWAHGWPCTHRDHAKMQEGATWLMTEPTFVIWSLNLAVELIPLAFNPNISLLKRMQWKERVVTDPLKTGPVILKNSMPVWAKDVTTLKLMVPSRGPGVGPSSRTPLDGKALPCYTKVGRK